MRKIIVANWKMNGSLVLIETFRQSLGETVAAPSPSLLICPPFPFLGPLATAFQNTPVRIGAQNCHPASSGAFTGEVSASMLADMGCQAVIVGHSERRTLAGETDALVQAKAEAAHKAGMTAIICVGESQMTRESGQAIESVRHQLRASLPASANPDNTMIAYEPIWAIGTGLTAAAEDITAMHRALSETLGNSIPLLYGGSVTEENAASILRLPYVDGVLVGGASLKPVSLQNILAAGAS